MSRHVAIATDEAPTPTGPFNQAIRHGSIIVTAGQAGRNRETGKMGDLEEQTTWALRNIAAILKAAGASLDDVVKVTLFVKEGESTEGLNRAYTAAFGEPLPARTLVFVSRLKNDEMLIELEALAIVD